MELVEGQNPKGPLPLTEALNIARQIAEALEAAHRSDWQSDSLALIA